MKPVAILSILFLAIGFSGCETVEPVPAGTLTKGEEAIRKMSLDGLKLGDSSKSLERFAQVQGVPFGRSDYEIYEIYNPNSQISLALAYFSNDRLKRLELRYFDGNSSQTLTRAGGWTGLKDYLVARFGPPSREGNDVGLATDLPGLKKEHAKFNGEWNFSRQNRQINYVVLSDARGGVGVVTLQDTTPAPRKEPDVVVRSNQTPQASRVPVTPTAARAAPPNPGF